MNEARQWQLEADAAGLYERYVHRHILGPWVPPLLDLVGLRSGERLLDMACGTGAVTLVAAQRVGASGRVTGLDLNGRMLDVARSRPPPPGAAISWVERNALDTGLPDQDFDVVVCQQGLQFFPDKARAVLEMHRVLARGGRLAISVWRSAGIYNAAVAVALEECVSADAGLRFRASRDVPADDELRHLAIAAGFEAVTIHLQRRTVHLPPPRDFVICHLGATPVAPDVKAIGQAARAALVESVARRLSAFADGHGISFPEEVLVVTATA